MWVKMVTVSAGPDGVIPSGAIREVSDAEGMAIIDGHFGERVQEPRKSLAKPAESASIEAPQNAMLPNAVRKIPQRRG
jgi:hypothetical protein